VRYSLEESHINNKEKITKCDIVFITVSANTTHEGFYLNNIREALEIVGENKIAVIKLTLLPETANVLKKYHPLIAILFSSEFLSEVAVAHNPANPFSNIVGVIVDDESHHRVATQVHEIPSSAPFALTCDSDEAEIIKYAYNIAGFIQVATFNLMYDMTRTLGYDWDAIKKALVADPFIKDHYINPIHKSSRRAGGDYFVKDFAAFANEYEKLVVDDNGVKVLRVIEKKNKETLIKSGKYIDLLEGVCKKNKLDIFA